MEPTQSESQTQSTPQPEISEVKPSTENDKESPESKVLKEIKPYPFISFLNGKFNVTHEELTQYLTPKILKVGDLARRGVVLANLNGGASNVDGDTLALNSFVATITVGYSDLPPKLNLLAIEDTNLISGLYVAVRAYNDFFRKTPLGIII